MISITVQSSEGTVLAYAEHPEEAWLSVDRAYLPGDVIRITGSSRLRVRMDQALPAGEVFLPSGVMTWPVPAGEHRLAYAPGTFEAPRHIIFAAAVPGNVIDGLRLNSFHGEWPFQSWGIGAREDAWCELDFGRPVIAEKMALTLRADFPHDAYWTAGHVVLSDGTDLSFSLRKTADRQWIDLGGRTVSRLRLERLVKSDDPSAFPALRQWEVFGREQA